VAVEGGTLAGDARIHAFSLMRYHSNISSNGLLHLDL
jgi:hypothetical protein